MWTADDERQQQVSENEWKLTAVLHKEVQNYTVHSGKDGRYTGVVKEGLYAESVGWEWLIRRGNSKMGLTQKGLNTRYSKRSGVSYQTTSVEVAEVEMVKTETKTESVLVAAPIEQHDAPKASGVRPSVAASLENSIEKNAAVWIALANH